MKTASYQLQFSCIFSTLLDINGAVDASRLTIEPTPTSSTVSATASTNGGSAATSPSQSPMVATQSGLSTGTIAAIAASIIGGILIFILALTAIFLYKAKSRQNSGPRPQGKRPRAEKGDPISHSNPGAPREFTSVDQIVEPGDELASGRLKYPDNPEIVESGRTGGEGY